jgi:tetrahydromethanopterin S-methyltransferase subunit B
MESDREKIAVLQNQMDNVENKVDKLDTKIDMGFARLETLFKQGLDSKASQRDVEDLQDNQKWVVRTVIGLVIAAILGLIFTFK